MRDQNIDILRGLAAFVVVFIHTPEMQTNGIVHLFWLRVLPPATAIFAILAGWFMIQSLKKNSCSSSEVMLERCQIAQSFIKDKWHRIFIPYLVWSVIYVCVNCAEKLLRGKPFTYDFFCVSQWTRIIFKAGASGHLWFLVFLFYAQCLFCVWFLFARNKKWFNPLTFLIAVSIIACYTVPPVDSFFRRLLFMLGYLFLGSSLMLSGKTMFERYQRQIAICSCVGICLHIVLCIYLNKASPIAMFIPVLYVCAALSLPKWTMLQWVSNIGVYSMGIYIFHVLVVTAGTLMLSTIPCLNGINISPLFLAMVYFGISYGVILALRKAHLPGLHR